MAMKAKPVTDRIKARTVSTPGPLDTECWIFKGHIGPRGYGHINVGGTITVAHRASWTAFRGPIPEGMLVCHKCDIKLCCNPDHLFLGTHIDNGRDASTKGRCFAQKHPERLARGDRHGSRLHPERRPRGEGHPMAKINEEAVKTIRSELGKTADAHTLAHRFGVRAETIRAIARRVTWRHVG